MAERKIRNLTSDYLTCTICWNIFTQPKMLHCGHSFCAKCLEDYVRVIHRQRDCFECPVCRHPHFITPGSIPEDVILTLTNDTVSLSILKALGIQSESDTEGNNETIHSVETESESNDSERVPRSNFCACARHREKPLDIYCSRHDIVVCSECAALNHTEDGCERTSAAFVINKRLNALKCLVAQQVSDASKLFESQNPEVKTVKSTHDEFQKSIIEVEDSFNELYRGFRKRIESLKQKARETIEKDMSSFEVRRLQDCLVERVKTLGTETEDSNPNEILKILSDLCLASSELQTNIHELAEKVRTGSLMKYADGDLNVLDAFVSAVKQTMPEEFLTLDEIYKAEPDDKDFVVVTNSGSFLDFDDNDEESSDVSQQITFSAKCPNEEKCMLSGVAVLGNTAMVLVDQLNKKLKKFKLPEGRFLSELTLAEDPHQVTTLRESNSVAVTLWDVPKIMLISTDPVLRILKVLETETEYIGITSHVTDHVAAASIQCRRVDVLDTRITAAACGKKRETIFQSSRRRSFPDRLAATTDGRVVVRNRRKHEVCCFSRRDLLWSRRLKTRISDITCFRGKVFASLRDKNDIVSFREDGQGHVEHLRQRQPLTHPWALDGFKDCLVVTEDTPSDLVHVFVFA